MMKPLATLIVLVMLCTTCVGQDVVHIARRIIDGDTFEVESGRRVTLRGVIANDGTKSKAYLELLILDRPVTLSQQRETAWGETEAVVRWGKYDIGEAMIRWGQASRRSDGTAVYRQPVIRNSVYVRRPVQMCIGRT